MKGHAEDSAGSGADHVEDHALRETADLVQQVLRSDRTRPAFRERLRAELMAAHPEAAPAGSAGDVTASPVGDATAAPPRPRGDPAAGPATPARWRFPHRLPRRPARLAWVGAAAAAVVVGTVVAIQVVSAADKPQPVRVTALSEISGALSAAADGSLRLRFSEPLDRPAAVRALRLSPVTAIQATWQGDTLTVAPTHGFAPDTGYVLTVDRGVARTASGAPLAEDVHVVFGTAPVTATARPSAAPVPLPRTRVATVVDGSEAVVAWDGSLLVTGAEASAATGYRGGLVRVGGGKAAVRLAPATESICLSRSGRSIAYLAQAGPHGQIAFADGTGAAARLVNVAVDEGSPLGWIDDDEVSFVGGGHLRAVDRTGRVRDLLATPIDPAHDRLDLAPGGRYAYLGRAGGPGDLVELPSGRTHALAGVTGDPAFSPDGGTVVWVDGSGPVPRLTVAASGGGPVRTVPLPVGAGDVLSDLSVSPDAVHVAYSVTHTDQRAELRLAALSDGHTLAVSADGAGQSPNWSPSGRLFTVLTAGAGGSQIDTVTVPEVADGARSAAAATAAAFAAAQVGSDTGAQRALGVPGLGVPVVPAVTRATVLWVTPAPDGSATAAIRLTRDPQPGDPVARQVQETLALTAATNDAPPMVRAVTAGALRARAPGPQLLDADPDAVPGTVLLGFDADLDPGSVAPAVRLVTPDGASIASAATYDAGSRTVRVRPLVPAAGPVVLRVGTDLRDADHHPLDQQLSIGVVLDG